MADGGGLCRSELAPGGVPTKNLRAPRGVRLPAASLTSIASKLTPTEERRAKKTVDLQTSPATELVFARNL